MHQHEPWSIFLPEQDRTSPPPQWLQKWSGDGIIARIETSEVAQLVARKGLPAVDVSAAREFLRRHHRGASSDDDAPW